MEFKTWNKNVVLRFREFFCEKNEVFYFSFVVNPVGGCVLSCHETRIKIETRETGGASTFIKPEMKIAQWFQFFLTE